MAEYNSGRPRTNLVKAVGAGLELVASRLQVYRSYRSATRALELLSNIGEMPNKRNAKSVAVDAFTDSHFFKITIIHLAYPQKFCRRSIVSKEVLFLKQGVLWAFESSEFLVFNI